MKCENWVRLYLTSNVYMLCSYLLRSCLYHFKQLYMVTLNLTNLNNTSTVDYCFSSYDCLVVWLVKKSRYLCWILAYLIYVVISIKHSILSIFKLEGCAISFLVSLKYVAYIFWAGISSLGWNSFNSGYLDWKFSSLNLILCLWYILFIIFVRLEM